MLAALTLLLTLPALALAADFAVVRGGRLNLRQYPSSSSQSLGKYASGSWVDVQGQGASGWYAVRTMDGKTGYMAGNYLTFAQSGSIGTVAYANGGYVNLRRGPSLDYAVVTRVTSGTTISILDASYEWNYVSATVNGATYTGYMHDSLIIKSTTTATVSTRNGGKVNVRRGPSSAYGSIGSLKSGTRVTVLLKGNGWYQITGGGLTDAVTAAETLPAAAAAELRIVKALEPVRVSDSGTLTYTFTIENYGSADADAAAGVTVTDRFDPILRNIAVTYNSDAWLASNYTYDPATGLFRTVPAAITVPAASAVQDPETRVWTVRSGTVTLQITGTI